MDTLLLARYACLYEKDGFVIKKNQAIGVTDGRISYLGTSRSDLQAKTTLRFDHHILAPGFVNTHTHLPMTLFRGVADSLPLKAWLEDYIFPLEKNFMQEDFVRLGTQLACLELIRSGVTTFCDMYFYSQALAQETLKAGLRGVIGVGVPTLEDEAKDYKKYLLSLKETYKDEARVCVAIAPHAPYTVDTKTLEDIGKFSKENNLPLLIHVSETAGEQAEIQKRHNKTPVALLHELGVTGPSSLFVHCVHASKQDLEIMKKTGTSFAYCPSSNMKLSSGIAPVTPAFKQGLKIGLGTDGAASNNNLNFLQEMNIGVKLQALEYASKAINAEDMFFISCLGGAQTLNLDKEIGTLEEGKWADVIAIDLNQDHFLPDYNLFSHLSHSAIGNEVSFTMCQGKVLMKDRVIQTLDQNKIYKDVRVASQKIKDFLK